MNRSLVFLLRNLTASLLAGEWTPKLMIERAQLALATKSNWLNRTINDLHKNYPTPPSEEDLLAILLKDESLLKRRLPWLLRRGQHDRRDMVIFWKRPSLGVPDVPILGTLPSIPTMGELAEWLDLKPGQLIVYADLRRWNRAHDERESKRHPYYYRWIAKRSQPAPTAPPPPPPSGLFGKMAGWFKKPVAKTVAAALPSKSFRLLEIPKTRLKRAQRKIHDEILSLVAPHAAAHAFRWKRSIVTNAEPHCGQHVVLKFDLKDFFPSIPPSRVKGLFTSLGYPPTVARLLAGLCTTVTPDHIVESENPSKETQDRYSRPHLPQGAPTSPALANLAAFRLDCRLAGLAANLGAQYTRYADDLTFSGGPDLRAAAERVRRLVTTIAAEEGFAVNAPKTKVMGKGGRQRIAGVVVNERPNVCRADFDELKAILTNCVRHGPASQNRAGVRDFRAHLAGRLSHVALLNPNRGAKLQAIFARIVW